MKLSQITCTGALAAFGMLFSTGCVTQRNYDDLSVALKRAQQDLYERDARIVELQNSLAAAKKTGAAMEVNELQNAGMGGDIDRAQHRPARRVDGVQLFS